MTVFRRITSGLMILIFVATSGAAASSRVGYAEGDRDNWITICSGGQAKLVILTEDGSVIEAPQSEAPPHCPFCTLPLEIVLSSPDLAPFAQKLMMQLSSFWPELLPSTEFILSSFARGPPIGS